MVAFRIGSPLGTAPAPAYLFLRGRRDRSGPCGCPRSCQQPAILSANLLVRGRPQAARTDRIGPIHRAILYALRAFEAKVASELPGSHLPEGLRSGGAPDLRICSPTRDASTSRLAPSAGRGRSTADSILVGSRPPVGRGGDPEPREAARRAWRCPPLLEAAAANEVGLELRLA